MLKCPSCHKPLKHSDLKLENCPHCGSAIVVSDDKTVVDLEKTVQLPQCEGEDLDAADVTIIDSNPESAEDDATAATFISEVLDEENTFDLNIDSSSNSEPSGDVEKTIPLDSESDAQPEIEATVQLSDSDDVHGTMDTIVNVDENSDKTVVFDSSEIDVASGDNATERTLVGDDPEITSAINKSLEDDWSIAINNGDPPTLSIRSREYVGTSSSSSLVIKPKAVQTAKTPLASSSEAEYEILSILGKGGMGVVYEARQTSIDRSVAVKMLGDKTKDNVQGRQKFLAEAVVTGELDHPNVVPIYDVGINDRGSLFYSMKKVQGTPWKNVIGETSRAKNLDILMRVADAVAFAHSRGVVHRDLKPENVMLGDFGEVLVMDWGLAQPTPEFRKKDTIVNVRFLGGTPAYMAPEMVVGPVERIGPASDIYLLGAILYEILTGKPPHSSSNLSQALVKAGKNILNPPEEQGELVDIAMKAMATNPEDRFADVRDFQEEIRKYQSHTESIALASLAEDNLHAARESGDYEVFSRAMFGFEESVSLWEGNVAAQRGAAKARLEYARTALDKGDLDLAESLLEADNPDHSELRGQVLQQQDERKVHKRRLRTARRLVRGLVATILVVVSGALLWVMKAEQQARHERDIAETQRQIADEQRQIAVKSGEQERLAKVAALQAQAEEEKAKLDAVKARDEALIAQQQEAEERKKAIAARNEAVSARQLEAKARQDAVQAKDEAVEARDIAETERRRAEIARKDAIDAKEAEEYEAYIARIGLAAAKIDENAFDSARTLLEACHPRFRQWEWGRLMYLCSQDERSFAVKTPANCLALSPDNKYFVTGGDDGKALLWDAASGELLQEIPYGGQTVQALAFSPDGRFVALGGDDPRGLIKLWDRQSATLVKRSFGRPVAEGVFDDSHTANISSLQFSHDGCRLLSASLDATARLWDVETGRQIHRFFGHNWWVWSAKFCPEKNAQGKLIDEKRIVTASQDGTVIVWSDESGQWTQNAQIQQGIPFRGHEGPVYAAVFSPDGNQVLSGGYDRRILIWDPNAVTEFDYLRLAEGGDDSEAEYRELVGHTDSVRTIQFSDKGALVVSGGRDNTVRVWDPESGKAIRTFRGHGSWIAGASFSRDGRWIISAGHDAQVKRWSLESNDEIQSLHGRRLDGHTDAVLGASFSPDGNRVVTASQDRFAKSWSAETGDVTQAFFEGHQFLSSTVNFLQEGQRLITSAMDNSTRIWDLASGTQVIQLDDTGRSAVVAVSSDSRWIVTGSSGTTVQLWDAENGGLLRQLIGHAHEVTAVAVTTQNGNLVLSGDRGGRCWLWDAETGEQIHQLSGRFGGHSGRIVAVGFTADGHRALTASTDHTIAQWDVATGQEIVDKVLKHPESITAMAVSSEERIAVTGCADGVVRYWDIESGSVLHSFIEAGGVGSIASNLRALMEKKAWGVAELSDQSGVRETVVNQILSGEATIDSETVAQLAGAFQIDVRELRRSIPSSVSISKTGLVAVVYSADSKVRVWKLSDGSEVLNKRYPFLVWAACFDQQSDDDRLAVVGGNQTHLIDATTGETKMSFGPHGAIASANYSPDGTRLVTGSWDNSARIWDANKGRVIAKLEGGHTAAINTCVFSPDAAGRFVLTSSDDGTAKLWEVTTELRSATPNGKAVPVPVGRVVRTFAGHSARVGFAAFSPDGHWVLTASDDKTAAIWESGATAEANWNTERVEPICILRGHEWEVLSIQMSADGKRIITGSADKTARIWELSNQADGGLKAVSVLSLEGHTSSVTCAVFSPLVDVNGNGRWDEGEENAVRAITSSQDNTVKLWDTRIKIDAQGNREPVRAKEILTLTEHNRTVTSVAFSRDGRRVLSAGRDGRAIVWQSVDWSADASAKK